MLSKTSTIAEVFEKLLGLIWERAEKRIPDQQDRKQGKKELFRRSIDAYHQGIIELDLQETIDQILFQSGILVKIKINKYNLSDLSRFKVKCRFSHKMLMEYCYAYQVTSSSTLHEEWQQQFTSLQVGVVNFKNTDRMLYRFLAYLVAKTTKWKVFFHAVVSRLIQNCEFFGRYQDRKGLFSSPNQDSARDSLGLNIFVDIWSILESIDHLATKELLGSQEFRSLVTTPKYFPVVSMMLIPAARYGNMSAIKWILLGYPNILEDINRAAVEALMGSHQEVSDYLQQNYGAKISLKHCVHLEYFDGIRRCLELGPSKKQIEEATSVAFCGENFRTIPVLFEYDLSLITRLTCDLSPHTLSYLRSLTNLTKLNLKQHRYDEKVTCLSELTNLQKLDLHCDLPNADFSRLITPLSKLTRINLSQLPITDISPINWSTSLQKLVLSGLPGLSDLSSMKLTNLEHLEVQFCTKITDINVMTSLTKLQTLLIRGLENISTL